MAYAVCAFDATMEGSNALLTNVTVEVRRAATGTLEPVFSDRDGGTPLGNPFVSSDGKVEFFCAGGAFNITLTKGAYSRPLHYKAVGLAAESDLIGGLFPPLEGDIEYHVDEADGDDANNGVTADTAFATGQKAADVIAQLNFGSQQVDLILHGATVTGDITFSGVGVKGHSDGAFLNIHGASKISGTLYAMSFENCPVEVAIDELTIGDGGIVVGKGATVDLAFTTPPTFDEIPSGAHITVFTGGDFLGEGPYTIAGGASNHVDVEQGGRYRHIDLLERDITLTGTPEFTDSFIRAAGLSYGGFGFSGVARPAFVGAAIGVRAIVDGNSLIDAGGAGPTYLPGDSAVVESNGGKYV